MRRCGDDLLVVTLRKHASRNVPTNGCFQELTLG
jgi:hypothetical protein